STGYRCPLYDGDMPSTDDPLHRDQPEDPPTLPANVTAPSGLKERLAARDAQIDGLTDFRERALSQIAAQRMEIERLRDVLAAPSNVRALRNSSGASAPYGSCS
ncbi:hypothetical protein ACGFR8_27970, partial [Streptomyces brevispora]